jgi:hypothetical protein
MLGTQLIITFFFSYTCVFLCCFSFKNTHQLGNISCIFSWLLKTILRNTELANAWKKSMCNTTLHSTYYIISYSYLSLQPCILLKLSSNNTLTMDPSFLLKFFFLHIVLLFVFLCDNRLYASEPQLTLDYYASTCPTLFDIVRKEMECSVLSDPRNAASIVRLHFHDCFIQVLNIAFFLLLLVFSC